MYQGWRRKKEKVRVRVLIHGYIYIHTSISIMNPTNSFENAQAAERLEKTKKAHLAKMQRAHQERVANLEPLIIDAAEQERRKNLLKSTRAVKGTGLKATMERMKALKASKSKAAAAPVASAASTQPVVVPVAGKNSQKLFATGLGKTTVELTSTTSADF